MQFISEYSATACSPAAKANDNFYSSNFIHSKCIVVAAPAAPSTSSYEYTFAVYHLALNRLSPSRFLGKGIPPPTAPTCIVIHITVTIIRQTKFTCSHNNNRFIKWYLLCAPKLIMLCRFNYACINVWRFFRWFSVFSFEIIALPFRLILYCVKRRWGKYRYAASWHVYMQSLLLAVELLTTCYRFACVSESDTPQMS